MSVLRAEIEESLELGGYPNEFPRWSATLGALDSKYSTCQYLIDGALRFEAPKLMYKLVIGTYQEDDLFRFMRYNSERLFSNFKGFEGEVSVTLKPGVIRVQNEHSDLPFSMNCYSSSEIYSSKLNQYIQEIKSSSGSTEVSVKVDLSAFESQRESIYKRKDVLSRYEVTDREKQFVGEMSALHTLLEATKSFANSISNGGLQSKYINGKEEHEECNKNKFPNSSCDEINYFIEDIVRTHGVSISPCRVDAMIANISTQNINNESTDLRGCSIVTSDNSNSRYLVYFSYKYSESDLIQWRSKSELNKRYQNYFDNLLPGIALVERFPKN